MSVDMMRVALTTQTKYKNSAAWAKKVAAMPDNQVVAVYYRLKRADQLKY